MSSFNSNKSTPVVLSPSEWDIDKLKFLPPRVNDMGGKAINVISTQSNRSLHIATPLMMTWGIADYVNEHGESDGKFSRLHLIFLMMSILAKQLMSSFKR